MAILTHTTPALVRGVLGADYATTADGDLAPTITAAAVITNARLVSIVGPPAYSPDEIVVLETWLAAHFYLVGNPTLRRESIGRSSQEILTQPGMNLNLTHPGQQVQLLDYLGGLVGLGAGRKQVKVRWMGRTAAERGIPSRQDYYGGTYYP